MADTLEEQIAAFKAKLEEKPPPLPGVTPPAPPPEKAMVAEAPPPEACISKPVKELITVFFDSIPTCKEKS